MGYIEENDFGRRVEKSKIIVDEKLNIVFADNYFYQLINSSVPKNLYDGVIVDENKEFISKMKCANKTNRSCFIFSIMARQHSRFLFIDAGLYEDSERKLYEILFYDPVMLVTKHKSLCEKNTIYESLLSNFDLKYFYYNLTEEKVLLRDFNGLDYSFTMAEFLNNLKDEEILPKDSDTFSEFSSYLLVGKERHSFEFDTNKKKYIITCNPISDVENDSVGIVGSIMIQTDKNLLTEKTNTFDYLTKTLNKASISEYAQNKIDICNRPTTLMMLDIDDFKEINDTYGHMFGDAALTKVASAIKKVVYGKGKVGRFGGDEFLIVLDDIVDEEEVKGIARGIRVGIQWCLTSDGFGMYVGCSIGIARYPDNSSNFSDLFKVADKCLYIAKMKGKSRYILYNKEKHGEICENTKNDFTLSRKRSNTDFKYNLVKKCILQEDGWLDLVMPQLPSVVGQNVAVNVYIGKNMECKHHCGSKYSVINGIYIVDKKYLSRFEGNEFTFDNVIVFESEDKELYKFFMEYNIRSTYQYLLHDTKGNVMGALSVEVYSEPHTFKNHEMDVLAIVAKSIEEYYQKGLE